jgi:hypothetical protein
MTAGIKIGTLVVHEDGEWATENHTSYAADHRTYRVLAGTYDINYTPESTGYILVGVDIEVSSESLYSGFGGVNYAVNTLDILRKSRKTFQLYAYGVAEQLSNSTDFLGGTAKLAEDWAIVVHHVTLPASQRFEERTRISRKFVQVPR